MSWDGVSLPGTLRSDSGILLEDWENVPDATYRQILEQLLNDEQKAGDCQTASEERFAMHKACMARLIERLPAYRPLLAGILSEYENFAETIQRGETEAFFLESKLQSLKGEQGTLRNYEDRISDLQHKVKLIEMDNARLETEIHDIKCKREEEEAKRLKVALESGEVRRDITPRQRCLIVRHLTAEHLTDFTKLKNELATLEASVREMQNNYSKRFVSKAHKDQLQEQLKAREIVHDRLCETNNNLKMRLRNLKIAYEATTAYRDQATGAKSLADVVELAMAGQNYRRSQVADPSMEDDDPVKEKETQMVSESIEKFNQLMTEKKYQLAAVHAANSPQGVLRTSEVLEQFKAVSVDDDDNDDDEQSPLLLYCQTLLATVGLLGVKPNEADSVECAQCALRHNKLDLLAHWLAADSLTCSISLGKLIEEHVENIAVRQQRLCYSLAQTVYTQSGAYRKAAVCMCRQGRYFGMMRYTQEVAHFQQEDYQFTLEVEPTCELALALIHPRPPVLSVNAIVTTLQTNESSLVAFYKELACQPNLEKLVSTDSKTSYERWIEIVHQCETLGLHSQAANILSATKAASTASNAVTQNDG